MKYFIGKLFIVLAYILISLITLTLLAVIVTKTYAGFTEDGIWGAFMSFSFWLIVGGFVASVIMAITVPPFYILGKKLTVL